MATAQLLDRIEDALRSTQNGEVVPTCHDAANVLAAKVGEDVHKVKQALREALGVK